MSWVPYLGAALVGYFVYCAYKKSMGNVDHKGNDTPGDPGMSMNYQEVDDAQRDPLNTSSNLSHLPVVRRETGEFGNPRVIYEGASSNIVTYGNNYTKY